MANRQTKQREQEERQRVAQQAQEQATASHVQQPEQEIIAGETYTTEQAPPEEEGLDYVTIGEGSAGIEGVVQQQLEDEINPLAQEQATSHEPDGREALFDAPLPELSDEERESREQLFGHHDPDQISEQEQERDDVWAIER